MREGTQVNGMIIASQSSRNKQNAKRDLETVHRS